MNAFSETFGVISLGTNAVNVSYNHVDGGFKKIDLTTTEMRLAMKTKLRVISSAISTMTNKILMVF